MTRSAAVQRRVVITSVFSFKAYACLSAVFAAKSVKNVMSKSLNDASRVMYSRMLEKTCMLTITPSVMKSVCFQVVRVL